MKQTLHPGPESGYGHRMVAIGSAARDGVGNSEISANNMGGCRPHVNGDGRARGASRPQAAMPIWPNTSFCIRLPDSPIDSVTEKWWVPGTSWYSQRTPRARQSS